MYPRLFQIILALVTGLVAFQTSVAKTSGFEKGVWLWAGVAKPELPSTQHIYLHQATLERKSINGLQVLRKQGLGPIKIGSNPLFIVYRLELLPKATEILRFVKRDIERWKAKGNIVLGVQIDFDSPSRNLEPYINFLTDLKILLPAELKLSVTGLADWASSASPAELNRLFDVSDEIAFQLYNGRAPIPHIDQYLMHLSKLERPFMVGILRQQIEQIERLQKSIYYQGYLVFESKI